MTRERSILKCLTALYDAGLCLIVVQPPHEKSQEEGLGGVIQHRLEMLAYVREARIAAENKMSILLRSSLCAPLAKELSEERKCLLRVSPFSIVAMGRSHRGRFQYVTV